MENENKIYEVPEQNFSVLQQRIAKLAKRAAKLSVSAPILTVVDTFTREIKKHEDILPVTVIRTYYKITIAGEAPKIAGWSFAAVLEPLADENGTSVGNILRVVPGFDSSIPERYRTAGNNCDHCHTERRRNETFVLVSDSGEWKQVGRNCLRDFLGHVDPNTYAAWAEILIDAADLAGMAEDEGFGGGRGEEHRYVAEEILALGASCIRLYGFVSNKTAREFNKQSTSSAVTEWIYASRESRAKWKHPLEVIESDKEQAAQVFDWMRSLANRPDLNDYFYNLMVLGKGATFTSRNFGLAISAISVWAKEQEREINRRKRFAADLNSQFMGEVKVRGTFENLTLVYTQRFENDFGVSTMYKFKSSEGNVLVWFTSGIFELPRYNATEQKISRSEIVVGDVVNLTAMVKAHEERDGVKQTKLTRAAIYEPKVKIATAAQMKSIAWA